MGPGRGRRSPRACGWSSRTSWRAAPRRARAPRSRPAPRAAAASSPGANACTSTTRSSASSESASPSGAAGRAPTARRHAGASRLAKRLGTSRQPVAVAGGLARRTAPCRPEPAPARTPRRLAAGRGCGGAPHGPARGRSSRRGRAVARRRRAPSRPRRPAARRSPRSVRSIPGRDVAAGRLADQAGAQQVEAEVARAGADLQRAPPALRLAAERLAHLRRSPGPGRSRRSRFPTWSRSGRPRRRGSGCWRRGSARS